MLDNLSDEQEEMILAGIRDVYKHIGEKEGDQAQRQLIEKLAQDENMLKRLTEMLDKYRGREGGSGG